jgi:hypothetical protein
MLVAFSRQQCLCERVSILGYTCIASVVSVQFRVIVFDVLEGIDI